MKRRRVLLTLLVLCVLTLGCSLFPSASLAADHAAQGTRHDNVALASSQNALGRFFHLRYVRGYSLQGPWLCYGWANGVYRCTVHHVGLRSTNPAWVPNLRSSSGGVPPRAVPAKPATPAVPASDAAPVGSVQSQIVVVFGADAPKALRVAKCESGYNPNAFNPSGASGVFQFLRTTWSTTPYAALSPFNATANIAAAHWLFVRDGHSWREWQCGGA